MTMNESDNKPTCQKRRLVQQNRSMKTSKHLYLWYNVTRDTKFKKKKENLFPIKQKKKKHNKYDIEKPSRILNYISNLSKGVTPSIRIFDRRFKKKKIIMKETKENKKKKEKIRTIDNI